MRLPFQLRIGCWETKNLAGVSHWVMLTLYRKSNQASFSWIFAPFFDMSFQSARLNFSHWNNTEKNCTFSLFETSVNGNVTFAYIIRFTFTAYRLALWSTAWQNVLYFKGTNGRQKTYEIFHIYCIFYYGFMCQTTVIFGITKDGSLVLNPLASWNCFTCRNLFRNGVNDMSECLTCETAFCKKAQHFV